MTRVRYRGETMPLVVTIPKRRLARQRMWVADLIDRLYLLFWDQYYRVRLWRVTRRYNSTKGRLEQLEGLIGDFDYELTVLVDRVWDLECQINNAKYVPVGWWDEEEEEVAQQ